MPLSLILIFTLIVNKSNELFLFPSNIDQILKPPAISFSRSKKILKNIYINSNRNLTFYCNCFFNSKKGIDIDSCNYSPRNPNRKRSKRLEFEHVVPVYNLGKNLQCWKEPMCQNKYSKKYKGRRCCSKISTIFKKMESDMHNLFPTIGEINEDRSNHRFGEILNKERKYGACDFKVSNRVVEPRDSIKGDIARAYFYMSQRYKISILESYENLLRNWHLSDPPDNWEMDRNSLIEEVQGNRNTFIDSPEIVERIRDF